MPKILKVQNKGSELANEAVGNHRINSALYSQEKIMDPDNPDDDLDGSKLKIDAGNIVNLISQDKIPVIDKGMIVQEDSHGELLEKGEIRAFLFTCETPRASHLENVKK
ncbi:ABC-type xenobiotic transporter [Sarracenia purpurea var. burkii]